MLAVIVRSMCVGIATTVAVCYIATFGWLAIALHSVAKHAPAEGGGEIGWDLVSLSHNAPPAVLLFPVLVFAIGFLIGFRYFSKSLPRR